MVNRQSGVGPVLMTREYQTTASMYETYKYGRGCRTIIFEITLTVVLGALWDNDEIASDNFPFFTRDNRFALARSEDQVLVDFMDLLRRSCQGMVSF